MKNFITILLCMGFMSTFVKAESGPSGGDTISPEFVKIFQSLPELIERRRADFPEVDLEKLKATVFDPRISVELKSNLEIQSSPKHATSDKSKKLILIDPTAWQFLGTLTDGELRKTVLALHEALVFMELEKTGDFHISNRLFIPPGVSAFNFKSMSTAELIELKEELEHGINMKTLFLTPLHKLKDKVNKMTCRTNVQTQFYGANVHEVARLREGLKIRIAVAQNDELMYYELANEAMRTSSLSKGVAVGSVAMLVVTGTAAGLAAMGQSEIGAFATGLIGLVVLPAGVMGELANRIPVDEEQALEWTNILVEALKDSPCDLSHLHWELTELRKFIRSETDQSFYRTRNAVMLGNLSRKMTGKLYSVALLDRIIYELELAQLDRILKLR